MPPPTPPTYLRGLVKYGECGAALQFPKPTVHWHLGSYLFMPCPLLHSWLLASRTTPFGRYVPLPLPVFPTTRVVCTGRRTIWRWPNNIVTRSRGEVLKTVQSKIVVASDDDCYALSFGESKSIWGDYMGIYFVASLPGWDGRKYKKLLHRKTHWNMNHRTSGQEQQ